MTKPIPGPPSASTGPGLGDDELAAILGDWTAAGHGGLGRRLAHALRAAVTGGLLAGGTRLPPERRLAELLSVSRSTVTGALDELRAEGLVISRRGSGTEVAGTGGPGPVGGRVGAHFVHRGTGIDLAAVMPTTSDHLPPMSVRTEDLLAAHGVLEPHGLPSLREALATRQSRTGRRTAPEEILVTNGAYHGLALAVDALVSAGDRVAVETPSYPGVLDLVDLRRARAVGVEGDRSGPTPEALARVLERDRPRLVYLQTGVHNPTGRLIGPGRRRALAEVLDRHGDAVVVEDNTLADLVFAGRAGPDLATLCRVAPVVTLESLSKVAWASLRIGWLRATGVIGERIARTRVVTDMGPSVPSQLLALQLLPELDVMAERRRTSLAASVELALDRVRADLPGWTVVAPMGSSALWIELPLPDASAFVALARRHGVHVIPGSAHRTDGGPDPHLRVCVDRPPGHVAEGFDRLAAAWRDLTARSERSPA